ncbi:peptidoglycan-binding protein [Streptomyces sp. NPDC055103]
MIRPEDLGPPPSPYGGGHGYGNGDRNGEGEGAGAGNGDGDFETAPLLLHGIGRIVDPATEQDPARGRKRGMVVAAVAAVAVAGTAAFAAVLLAGGDETDDRAAVPEVTTSASLNVAVSEAPTSETPEPTPSTPSARPSARPSTTSASPSPTPTPSRTTAAAPPRATTTAAPTTAAPTTAPPTTRAPEETTEEPAPTLRFGSTGAEVLELQKRLTLAGAYHGSPDGEYDQEVWRAVKSYQSWMYIEGDPKGVYGPRTREALERSTVL